MIWVHISSCFILDFEPVYFKKLRSESQPEFILRIGKVIFKYANFALFIILASLWPLFAWLNWSWTQLDTDYYAIRYFYYFLYMAIHMIPYAAVDNMQHLVGDGFFLT